MANPEIIAERRRRSLKRSSFRASTMPTVIYRWLELLKDDYRGKAVDQLEHSLQAATLAASQGADDDLVIAALCHDIGKVVSGENHGILSACILEPYVSEAAYHIVAIHQDFAPIYNTERSGLDPYSLRKKYVGQPWYDLALIFSDSWDSAAYDPSFKSPPLSYFKPLIHRVFSTPTRRVEPGTGVALTRPKMLLATLANAVPGWWGALRGISRAVKDGISHTSERKT